MNNKSHVIVIRGSLGVGKTTIARKLSKKLDAVNFSVDDILEKIGRDDIESDNIPASDFLKVNNYMLPKIKDALKKNKNVVIDGCFYHKEQITDLEKNLNQPLLFITLKAPVDVCISRDKDRKISYGKDAATAVFNMVSKFDYGVTIQTEGKTEDEILEEVLSSLKK